MSYSALREEVDRLIAYLTESETALASRLRSTPLESAELSVRARNLIAYISRTTVAGRAFTLGDLAGAGQDSLLQRGIGQTTHAELLRVVMSLAADAGYPDAHAPRRPAPVGPFAHQPPERDIWSELDARTLPARQRQIDRVFGRPVPLEIDRASFGADRRLVRGLEYDLEMLVRGLDPAPFGHRGAPVDREALHAGIDRIRVRRAAAAAGIECAVREGVLEVALFGAFGPAEVEVNLVERDGLRVERWSNPPAAGLALPGELAAMRRWRVAAALRGLAWAAGRPLPVDLDWPGLVALAARRPDRVGATLRAIENASAALARFGPEAARAVGGPMPPEERERRARRAEAAARTVREAIRALRIEAGDAPAARLERGVLGVVVPAQASPLSGSQLAEAILEALRPDVEPLRRDLEQRDVPTAEAHLRARLDALIGERGGSAPDRVALRARLGRGPRLEVDWPSFLAGDRAQALAALARLETGHHNTDRHHGEFFGVFFYALEEAIRRRPDVLVTFLERVRSIDVVTDADPSVASIAARGASLVVRQGTQASLDLDDAPGALTAAVLALGTSPAVLTAPGVSARLAELLGDDLERPVESFERADSGALEAASRVLIGTVARMAGDAVVRRLLSEGLAALRFAPTPSVAFDGGTLTLGLDAPADSTAIEAALVDGLALTARAAIAAWESGPRRSWEELLARPEHVGREIPIDVDWEAFLADPERGGNQIVPYVIDDGAVKRLVHALTGWLADDRDGLGATLRAGAARLRVVPTAAGQAARIDRDGDAIVLRVAPRTYYVDGGTLTIDEAQMALQQAFERE